MADKHFIQHAINPAHKGDFARKAKEAGKTTREYAEEHQHDSGLLGHQARLALTLMGMHHAGTKHQAEKGEAKSKERATRGEKETKAHRFYPAHD